MKKIIYLLCYFALIKFNLNVLADETPSENNFNGSSGNTFPDDFIFGVATSAYQIEGAWNVNNKSESIWDRLVHERPESIMDKSNGDIADNSYYLYKEDIGLVQQLNANAYRISISWPRVLPDGFNSYINKDGIDYYNNVINEMLDKNITPVITIYHWDLPQKLQDLGGWTNPDIVNWFVDYAEVLFDAFGDRVKFWATINEPNIFCHFAYSGFFAPALNESGRSDYFCGHHVLLAHAKTYRMYKEKFYEKQRGSVGFVVAIILTVPENPDDPEEVAGAELSWKFWNGWFLNPVFGDKGDYPQAMKDRIANFSSIQGFSQSRLPKFTPEQIQLVKSSSDFYGFNYYSAMYQTKMKNHDIKREISFDGDIGMSINLRKFPMDRSTPWAMEKALKRINEDYNIPYFLITENGYWDEGSLEDTKRAQYYRDHLEVVLNLIHQGLDIRGYFAWSLLDNFEWSFGYTQKYGLFSVDYSDPNRTRKPKFSSKMMAKIYKFKTLPSSI